MAYQLSGRIRPEAVSSRYSVDGEIHEGNQASFSTETIRILEDDCWRLAISQLRFFAIAVSLWKPSSLRHASSIHQDHALLPRAHPELRRRYSPITSNLFVPGTISLGGEGTNNQIPAIYISSRFPDLGKPSGIKLKPGSTGAIAAPRTGRPHRRVTGKWQTA